MASRRGIATINVKTAKIEKPPKYKEGAGLQQTRNGDAFFGGIVQGASWAVIIVAFIFFFPIGIILLLIKMHKEKKNALTNGKVTAGVGWGGIVIAILYSLMGITGNLDTSNGGSVVGGIVTMLLLCGGTGSALVYHGNQYKKMGKNYIRYAAILANNPEGMLDNVAAAFSCSYSQVCADLQRLLDQGFFSGCYLDLDRRSFVCPAKNEGTKLQRKQRMESQAENSPQNHIKEDVASNAPKVVKCPNCGGVNQVDGTTVICEYCGSPL